MHGNRRLPPRLTALVALAFAVQATSGCLSNEYRIPKEELARVVQLPPSARGERVRVLQQVGERRGEPVPPGGRPAPWVGPRVPEEAVIVEGEPEPELQVDTGFDLHLEGGRYGHAAPRGYGGGWRGPGAAPGGPPRAGGRGGLTPTRGAGHKG